MAFTKVSPAGLTTTGSYSFGDINSTGTLTATAIVATTGTFSGNISVAGTITYDDVTNVDSIGVVTARSDVHVGAGLSVVGISSLGTTIINGQLTATNATITGVTTFGTSSISINGAHEYPSIRPTLDLNFAATKTLDRRITFTRDSLGTYTDELGVLKYASNNTPRFDHDPTTGESLGLLIEESRTNLAVYSTYDSTNFTNSTGTFVVNATTSPDGTLTAASKTSTSDDFWISDAGLSLSGSGTYVYSVYLKSDSNCQERLYFMDETDGTWQYETVNVTTEWKRFYIVVTSNTGTSFRYQIGGGGYPLANNTIYFWGIQVEKGSFATSYIPTSGSAVNRAADFAKITGTNFTDFYNQTEGTFFVEGNISPTASAKYFTIDDIVTNGSLSEMVELGHRTSDGKVSIFTYNSASTQSDIRVTPVGTEKFKAAAAFKVNDVQIAVDGTLGTADTGASQPSQLDRMTIGNYVSGNYYTNCPIAKLSYYNKRLPNAQLQGLTAQ